MDGTMDHFRSLLNEEWSELQPRFIGLGAILVVDLLSNLLLYGAVTQWQVSAWGDFLSSLSHYNNTTAETVLLSLVRLFVLPFLLVLAVTQTSVKVPSAKKTAESKTGSIELTEDLDADLEVIGGLPDQPEISFTEEEKKSRGLKKKFFMGGVFAFLAGCEVVVGVKSVILRIVVGEGEQASYVVPAIFLGAIVFWINVELYLLNDILTLMTREEGILFPQLHAHPLFLGPAEGHLCNHCRKRGLKKAYSCPTCRYDLCEDCTKKQNKAGEGVLRTDSGVVQEVELTNWEYVKKAITFVKPHIGIICVGMLFLLVTAATNLLIPNYQGKIFDDVIQRNKDDFKSHIIAFLTLSLALGVLGSVRNLCFQLSARRVTNVIRNELYRAILKQDIAFFDGTSCGDLTSRLGNNTNAIVDPIQSLFNTLLSSFITLAGGLIMCLHTSWRLSLLSFTTIGPITLIMKEYSGWARDLSRAIWGAVSDSHSVANEAITNIRTVRAFGQEPREIVKYEEATSEALSKGEEDAYANVGTFALTSYLDVGITILMLWYGGTVAMDESDVLSVGNLITFQLYWNMMNNSFTRITEVWNSFTRAGGAAQRIISLLDLTPDIGDAGASVSKKPKGDLTLENIEFTYQMRPDAKVLKGINLHIPEGSVCALVGKSGCGKTTIINLLLRMYNPSVGSIKLDGTDIRQLNPIAYRKHFGIVAQDTELFNGTVEENIAYGVEGYSQKQLFKAAKLANAHEFILTFDEGYQTRVGSRGMRLSGGQKQRIALARVFLRQPKILLLDEATSALDAESEGEVQDAIDRLISRGKCTVILVAHRLSTVVNANKICVIHGGQIIEQGNHEELLRERGIYAKLVEKQLSRMQNDLETQGKDGGGSALDVIDALIGDESPADPRKEEKKGQGKRNKI